MRKTHYKRVDYRLESLTYTVEGIQNSVLMLNKKFKATDWYGGSWFLEEVEPILGLTFIALQNYINCSIYDCFGTLEKKHEKYKLGKKIKNSSRTDIELIVGIANYYKHRDENNLKPNTTNILKDCNFRFDKDTPTQDSPIFKGLEYYTSTWDLTKLIETVTDWREKLWRSDIGN